MKELKESTWSECAINNKALTISSDKAKAQSLLDTIEGRVKYLENQKIEESSANYIFEGYYTCILELLHMVVLLAGFKVINHTCLGYYVRDVLHKQSLFIVFDDCRIKRNALIYQGRKMDFETAQMAVEKSKQLVQSLKKIVSDVQKQ